jgi:hypothetical protein
LLACLLACLPFGGSGRDRRRRHRQRARGRGRSAAADLAQPTSRLKRVVREKRARRHASRWRRSAEVVLSWKCARYTSPVAICRRQVVRSRVSNEPSGVRTLHPRPLYPTLGSDALGRAAEDAASSRDARMLAGVLSAAWLTAASRSRGVTGLTVAAPVSGLAAPQTRRAEVIDEGDLAEWLAARCAEVAFGPAQGDAAGRVHAVGAL